MITTLPLRLCGTVPNRAAVSALVRRAGDAVLVHRVFPRLLVVSCPCGCGEEFPINLDPRSGPAWRLFQRADAGLSVFPSIWRESGCRSHFIIWRGKILLFGHEQEGELDAGSLADESKALSIRVYAELIEARFVRFSDLADAVDAIPWDVLVACRRLVTQGKALEGTGDQQGRFARAPSH